MNILNACNLLDINQEEFDYIIEDMLRQDTRGMRGKAGGADCGNESGDRKNEKGN